MDPLCNPAHLGLWGTIGPDIIKGLPAAFVALVIGMIAAAIAARQYLVARAKLNLDLFDRRYATYETVWKLLSDLGYRTEEEQMWPFARAIPSAYFLFGPEIGDYLETVRERGIKLVFTRHRAARAADNKVRADAEATIDEIENAFQRESIDLRARFGKYMDFSEWR